MEQYKPLYTALLLIFGIIAANIYGNHLIIFTGMFGILIFSYLDFIGSFPNRIRQLIFCSVIILILTPVAILLGDNLITTLLFASLIVFISSMLTAFGPQTAKIGFLLTAWLLIALSIPGDITKALAITSSLLVGGFIYKGFIVLTEKRNPSDSELSPETSILDINKLGKKFNSLLNINSQVLQFSIICTFAVAVAIITSWEYFEIKPLWAVYAVFFVMKPGIACSVTTGIERGLGTLVGAILASLTITLFSGHSLIMQVLFFIAVYGLIMEGGKRYYLFIFLITYSIIIYFYITSTDVSLIMSERIYTNLTGIFIAIFANEILKLWSKKVSIS